MKIINTLSTIFIILAVAACAQTTATKSTSQEREETRQTSPPSSKTSSETTESAQQESQTESESGAEAAAEAAAGQKAEAARLPTAAESELQKSERESGTRQSTAKDSADAKLAQAQENLRISQETEKRIAAELEQLKASGSASEEALRDYETYLKSVKAMTAENRKIVEQMEAAYVQKSSDEIGSGQPSKNELGNIGDPDIPEEQTMDEVTALDRQLNASLAKFDGLLLKEMDEIRAGSSKKLQDLAEEAAEAARRLRDKGLDVDTSGSKGAEDDQEAQEMESNAGRTGTAGSTSDGSRQGGQGPSKTDQRRAEYEDDDIVARQLREAAENETDPELKEKLWKEYEEYKKNK